MHLQQGRSFITWLFALHSLGICINGDNAISQRLQLLPQICEVSGDDDQKIIYIPTVVNKLIREGQTSKTRQLANECLLVKNNIQYSHHLEPLLKCCFSNSSSSNDAITEIYKLSKNELYQKEDFLQIIVANLKQKYGNTSSWQRTLHDRRCEQNLDNLTAVEIDANPFPLPNGGNNDVITTHGSMIIERWNSCCSYWRESSDRKCMNIDVCCEVTEDTNNHLILPALREPKLHIHLQNGDVIDIEQEGLLNLYDVSGVLWPAGYLLGLCLSNPVKCGIEDILNALSNVTALELGTGTGFAAIALSLRLRGSGHTKIIATDIAKSSLDLAITNAYRNGVEEMISGYVSDFTDMSSLLKVKSEVFNLSSDNTLEQTQHGFDIIIGSSLQSLFDGTDNLKSPLWLCLDRLLSRSNPNAVVVLSHVKSGSERIQMPLSTSTSQQKQQQQQQTGEAFPFELLRRISGDQFNMKTRDGATSDFELVILRRSQSS
jgi:predicted nicotinamide N-methyase